MEMMVSIICNTYNQQSYIAQALEGFLMQQTQFPFEILVHDDASTDATAQIVREYAEKYPQQIKPILQTENQYSRGVNITRQIQLPRAAGKYIAFCEGDDYWTDPLKLQKQVDALEQHPQVDVCAHQAMQVREDQQVGLVQKARQDTLFSPEEVILGGGAFVATASLMFRKALFDREYPFAKQMALDYIWQISGSLRGGMLYLCDCMSVYRLNAKGSWSSVMQQDGQRLTAHWARVQQILRMMDEQTEHRYESAVAKKNAMIDINIMVRLGKWKQLLAADGRKLLQHLPVKKRIIAVLNAVRRCVLMALAQSKRGKTEK